MSKHRRNVEKAEHDSINPSPRAPIYELLWKRIAEKYKFAPLSPESMRNLATVNEILKYEAIVIYVNHTSMNDALVSISLILSHLTNAVRYIGPAGMKHYDISRDPKNALLLRALRVFNIHAVPVVQHDDLEYYPPEKRDQLVKRLKQKTIKLLQKPRSVYGIAPEGKRNVNGTLLKARPGIGKLEKMSRGLKYLPIAIVYEKFSNKPQIVVGIPQTIENLVNMYNTTLPSDETQRAQKIADILMYKLSCLLPKQLRGYYSDFEL